MKKIAIVLFSAILLSSCGGGTAKTEGENTDTTAVAPTSTVTVDSSKVASADTTKKVETTQTVTPTK